MQPDSSIAVSTVAVAAVIGDASHTRGRFKDFQLFGSRWCLADVVLLLYITA
jgi:hypothetical protein